MLEVAVGRARLAPGAAIDLGGIAKGWLADRAVERIGPNSLANFAGDLRARGDGPDGGGWPVGFGPTTVLLKDIGAATSGTRGRRWGERSHHLIDPRTGLPADSDLAEVSVLAGSGADAEVLAKTALLLGREAGARLLDERSLGSYLV
jgi:thiamine biosynthesis lipoprotein